jgi:anaerobic selenocysteine-containing dehydrogenase
MALEHLHTYCSMCVCRCGVLATVEDGVLTKVTADPEHPNACICVKGTAAPELVYAPDRLQYPMRRTRPKGDPDPGWTRISWDEALALAASRLLEIKARYGPEAVAFAVATPSGGASGDFLLWAWRLANAFGSPNMQGGSTHICQWHRDFGARYTYGVGTPAPDIESTRCILLWGFNPQATWPGTALRITRARARGARLIVIDPRKTALAAKADVWLSVRPGADGALALSMIHVLLEERLYDKAFVREWTDGPFLVRDDTGQLLTREDLTSGGDSEQFIVWDSRAGGPAGYQIEAGYARDGVEPALSGTYTLNLASGTTITCRPAFDVLSDLAAHHAPERIEALTWVPAGEVRRAARLFAGEQPSCYYTWTGLEQRPDAMQTNRAVCLFYAFTGQFDQRGSNVLFTTTPTNPVVGRDLLPKRQAARTLGYAERPLGPPGDGVVRAHDVYHAILTGEPYPVKALVAFGADPLVAHADPLFGKQALEALDFYVHVDLFANPTASFADLLLPAASCWESPALWPLPMLYACAEQTATWAQYREPVVRPVHEARPDLEIIFELAQRLGLGEHFFGGDLEAAFNYQLAPSGLTVERLRAHPVGMRAPGVTRYQKYRETDTQTGQPRGFQTPTGRLELYATRFARASYPPLPAVWEPPEVTGQPETPLEEDYPLTLTFCRLMQFVNDEHRNLPRLRRQAPEPSLEIHPTTASALGIADEEWIVVETRAGAVTLKAKLSAALDPRVVVTQYGWWQACQALGAPAYDPFRSEGANGNLLVPRDDSDPITGSVAHRRQRCRVRKQANPAGHAR